MVKVKILAILLVSGLSGLTQGFQTALYNRTNGLLERPTNLIVNDITLSNASIYGGFITNVSFNTSYFTNVVLHNTLLTGTNEFTGDLSFAVNSISTVVDGTNTIDIGNSTYIRLTGSPSAEWYLAGFTNGNRNGRYILVENDTDENVIIHNEAAFEGTAENRILTYLSGSITNVTSDGNTLLQFIYNSAISRWILVSVGDSSSSITNLSHDLGGLYLTNAAFAQDVSATPIAITNYQFQNAEFMGVSPVAGIITNKTSGKHLVNFSVAFDGSGGGRDYLFELYTNGVGSGIQIRRKTAAADTGPASFSGIVDIPASTLLQVYVSDLGGASTLTFEDMQFVAIRQTGGFVVNSTFTDSFITNPVIINGYMTNMVNDGGFFTNMNVVNGYMTNMVFDTSYFTNINIVNGYATNVNNDKGFFTNGTFNSGYVTNMRFDVSFATNLTITSGYSTNVRNDRGFFTNVNINSGYVTNLRNDVGFFTNGNFNSGYMTNIRFDVGFATNLQVNEFTMTNGYIRGLTGSSFVLTNATVTGIPLDLLQIAPHARNMIRVRDSGGTNIFTVSSNGFTVFKPVMAHLRYQTNSATTSKGTAAQNWTNRTINVVHYDPSGLVTLQATNAFAINRVGIYVLECVAQTYSSTRAKLRLRNGTAGWTNLVGQGSFVGSGFSDPFHLQGTFTNLAAGDIFIIEQWATGQDATHGQGVSANIANTDEVYLDLKITAIE
jgi:hypothetical protein